MTTLHTTQKDILPPPSERTTPLGWVLRNLFNNWYNTLLTFLALGLAFIVIRGMLNWALTEARWAVVPNNLRLFLMGQYPSAIEGMEDYAFRLGLAVFVLAAVIGLSWGVYVRRPNSIGIVLLAVPVVLALAALWLRPAGVTFSDSLGIAGRILLLDVIGLAFWFLGRRGGDRLKRMANITMVLYPVLVYFLINGFYWDNVFGTDLTLGLQYPPDNEESLSFWQRLTISIPTRLWGGLLLSLILAIVGIVASFPIGVILALGRQSNLPVLRNLSILYIEFIRGVPLISLLFMGQVMLNFFLPQGIDLDRVVRAMVPITMFAAAYLAENVRGGLQSISRGQYEAAHALGLSGFQTMTFIILPQALRAVIPPIVGQFIGLFKDTTLVALVGLLDLLGIARGVIANPNYIGTQREVFLFISVFYFVFSYALSSASRRLEGTLGVGSR